jgi:presenilin-like A22 family membrane protease
MKEIAFLVLFFLATSIFSIYLGILTKNAIERGEIEPVFQNPYDYKNSFYMFALILLGTVMMIFFIKVRFELIKLLENLALFLLISTTFSYFFSTLPSFLLALFFVIFSELKPSFLLKNLCLFLSIPSASAIIGASLDYRVVLLFFLILVFYDIISVFLTKHMIYLAENLLSKPSALISVFPSRKIRKVRFLGGKKKVKIIALGAGDYFMPASFCVSLLSLGIKHSLVTLVLNAITLFLLFYFIHEKEVSRPLPAIPFLFLSSVVGFVISFYL